MSQVIKICQARKIIRIVFWRVHLFFVDMSVYSLNTSLLNICLVASTVSSLMSSAYPNTKLLLQCHLLSLIVERADLSGIWTTAPRLIFRRTPRANTSNSTLIIWLKAHISKLCKPPDEYAIGFIGGWGIASNCVYCWVPEESMRIWMKMYTCE